MTADQDLHCFSSTRLNHIKISNYTNRLVKIKVAIAWYALIGACAEADHGILLFQGWEEATTRGTNRQYCWQNFLSENTLKVSRECS